MAKQELITLRVDGETKRELEAAAQAQGQSLTTFMLDAASHAARRKPKMTATETPAGRHTGVPTFFRANCFEAQRGGSSSYRTAGYHLSLNLRSQAPYDLSNEEWNERLEQLRELADTENQAGVVAWFQQHYPRCMELVPQRRYAQFVAGIYDARASDRF